MIYDELRNLLVGLTDAEEVQNFDDAIEVFEKYGSEGYMDVFNLTIGQVGTDDAVALMDALRHQAIMSFQYMLSIQGVVLKRDSVMSDYITVLNALMDVIHYEDYQRVLDILRADYQETERFGELVHLTSSWSVERAMSVVDTIEPSFAMNLVEILSSKEQSDEESMDDISEFVNAYNKYKQMLDNVALQTDNIFNNPGAIGMPLSFYLQFFIKTNEDLSVRPIESIARELVAMALLSGDHCRNPLMGLKQGEGGVMIFNDLPTQTKLYVAIQDLVQKYGAFNA